MPAAPTRRPTSIKKPGLRDRLNARQIQRITGLACVRVYARLGSTNRKAAELVERGELAAPGVVLASRQTAGRGRGSNAWHSDAGSLTITFALPVDAARPAQELPLRAGLAVRAALSRWIAEDRLTIKWPNDVLADGRKIAGVLCERVRGADLVGIGINVHTNLSRAPVVVRARATSVAMTMAEQSPRRDPPARFEVLVDLVAAMQRSWEVADWCASVNRAHALTGKDVAVDIGEEVVRGRCEGVDSRGAIVLRISGKRRAILSGSVV